MRLGLRLFLGFFLIVGLTRVLRDAGVRRRGQAGRAPGDGVHLVDTANVLAAMAADDLKAGRIADGRFAADLARVRERDPQAMIWRFPKRSIDYRVTVTDARGIVVFDSEGRDVGRDNSRWNDVHRTLRGEYGARSSPESPGSERTVMHVAAPVFDPAAPGSLIGVLTVSKPNRTLEPFIEASQRSILRKGAWLIGLSALVGLLMTWWLARRIGRLNRFAQAVASGAPVPPPPYRRDEIGELGRALEDMRRKLEGKAYVEQYVQSLTHEMKSPLAAIRGAAELLQEPLPEAERRRFARHIEDQQQRLTETIDKLLALAEVEQHGWLQRREPVDVAGLLRQVAAGIEPRLTRQAAAAAGRGRGEPGHRAGRRLPAAPGAGEPGRQRRRVLSRRRHTHPRSGPAGRAGAGDGARPGRRRSRIRDRPGVRALLLAGAAGWRPTQLRAGPAVRTRSGAAARRRGLAGQR